jgi:beta-lactamase class D
MSSCRFPAAAISLFFTLLACLPGPAWSGAPGKADLFDGRDGCFIIVSLKDGKVIEQIAPSRCRERFSPCSTFKIPAAAMAFDRGIIDARRVFKWDGSDYGREACNHDQTIKSWIADSVVWVTQKLTAEIGMKDIVQYLKQFSYGNCDMSGGIDRAWLSSSLKISAAEQVAFLRKLWLDELPIKKSAQAETRELFRIESDGDDRLDGKTGSGLAGRGRKLGWFVGHVRHSGKDYVFALNFTDRFEGQTEGFAGMTARKMALKRLSELGLWKPGAKR